MPNMSDDIEELRSAVRDIMKEQNPETLNALKKELNRFFKGCECEKVFYTLNTDKVFFGMRVYPIIDTRDTLSIVQSDKDIRFNRYCVDIDSKLFDPLLNLSIGEVTAVLLHEVGHLTNNADPVREIRKAIDVYLSKSREVIRYSDDKAYIKILDYAITDTAVKLTSVFYAKNKEYRADMFVVRCGYGEELESALEKIVKKGLIINKDVSDKFLVLEWTLRIYRDVKHLRLNALKTINHAMSFTPSSVERENLRTLAYNLKKIDDKNLIESFFTEGNMHDRIRRLKVEGIDKFEGDYYDYNIMKNNVSDQDEALYLMRQINTRIGILSDVAEDTKLSEFQRKKYSKLLDKYMSLREELSKTIVYKDRFIGVVVNYPQTKGIDY